MQSEGWAEAVTKAIEEHGNQLTGAFTVLSPGIVSIRPPVGEAADGTMLMRRSGGSDGARTRDLRRDRPAL